MSLAYNILARTTEKTILPTVLLLLHHMDQLKKPSICCHLWVAA
jgi:hypothetical protein